MVTRADTLAHLVDSFAEPGDQDAHNPALPLVLGDQGTNKYSILSYNQINGTLSIVAVNGGSSSVLTFDDDGTIAINGAPITDLPELQQILADAQLAAQQAQASATTAASSATSSQNSANAAAGDAQEAADAALLSLAYAAAPADQQLPGGGVSAAVSAQVASTVAQESRLLDQAEDNVVASETLQSGHFFTERKVTVTTPITITLPPGLHSSPDKVAKWALYKLAAASGTVNVVGASDLTGFATPKIIKAQRTHFRYLTASSTVSRTISTTLASVGAVVSGAIFIVFNAIHNSPTVTPTVQSIGGTFTTGWVTLKTLTSPQSINNQPDSGVYMLPLTAFAGGNIDISILEGPYVWFQSMEIWVVDDIGVGTPVVVSSVENANRTNFTATQLSLPAQTLVLAAAEQYAQSSITGMGFANFSTNLTKTLNGITYGTPDVGVSDDNIKCNTSWAYGNGVVTLAGNFAMTANFSTATGRGRLTTISVPPKVGGGSAVTVNAEGGRTALTVPYGVLEIWAQPDGLTYEIRTSKP